MNKLFENFLDWIYKKKCYFCGSSKECVKMCSKCFDSLEHIPVKVNRTFNGVNIYCAGEYTKNLQKMIRGLKYHHQSDIAYYQARFMYEYWQKLNLDGNFQIVPVPIYPKRKKKRKYNHMDLVGEELSKLTGYELNTRLIKRVKDTKPQYNLKKSQRLVNLDKAFEVDKSKIIKGKRILLIDDICTTGSTFEEMIRELNKAEIYDIVCFATTTPCMG